MKKMDWQKLLTKVKIYPSSLRVNDDNDRSEFERDHNKVIFSPYFRHLQNKTQLFPIPQSDFIHTRLTHTLEVASVGKSLGNLVAKKIIENKLEDSLSKSFVKDVADIVSVACLLHDIGNPPFGHAGEDAISIFFRKNFVKLESIVNKNFLMQLSHFDGNAQSLRIINKSRNLNLTLASVATVIKYPTMFNEKSIFANKHSVFETEISLFEKAAVTCGLIKRNTLEYCRHPLTFLAEAADDICYRLLDLEDAHKMGLISFSNAEDLFSQIISSKNKNLDFIKENIKYLADEDKFAKLRSYALNILIGEAVNKFIENYEEIMSGQYKKLIANDKLLGMMDIIILENSSLSEALIAISNYIKKYAYSYRPVLEIELAGYEIINFLLQQFTFAILNEDKIWHLKNEKILNLLPKQCNVNLIEDPKEKIMSDKYALELYRKLNGIELPDLSF